MWRPVSKEKIIRDIEYCEIIFYTNPACLKFWNLIKVPLQKWSEKTLGEQGGGFWVVALAGNSVIYYNDIEEGYNLSAFTRFGEIDEYIAGQSELYELIETMHSEITNE